MSFIQRHASRHEMNDNPMSPLLCSSVTLEGNIGVLRHEMLPKYYYCTTNFVILPLWGKKHPLGFDGLASEYYQNIDYKSFKIY